MAFGAMSSVQAEAGQAAGICLDQGLTRSPLESWIPMTKAVAQVRDSNGFGDGFKDIEGCWKERLRLGYSMGTDCS